ncbi:MAG: hypothetical protein ABL966_13060 [Acidimicrobiales bacterium]
MEPGLPADDRALLHDLNNVLGAIMNYAQLVATELDRAVAGDLARPWDVMRADVAQIETASDRAGEIVRQLRG